MLIDVELVRHVPTALAPRKASRTSGGRRPEANAAGHRPCARQGGGGTAPAGPCRQPKGDRVVAAGGAPCIRL